jgi:putative membrane protein insertion efficiency factor
MIGRFCQSVALVILKAYKAIVSPWLGPACRFTPTCSDYAGEAIKRYGVLRGVGKALMRLLRCHPFCRGGWDPV